MQKPSTSNLQVLPSINNLKLLCQSIAALEAILSPEWEFRYYSYNKAWSPTEEIFEMRDGEGDQFHILFSPHGAIINGFSLESKPLIQELLATSPTIFHEFIFEEPIKSIGTTFCIWQHAPENIWHTLTVDDQDGSQTLLSILDNHPETYQKWAHIYYDLNETQLSLEVVKYIYTHKPITNEAVLQINPEFKEAGFEMLIQELDAIGYPHQLDFS